MTTTVSVERAMAEAKEVQERGIVGIYPLSLVALAAEVEALRKDAERYRWLRDKSGCVNIVGGGGKFNLPDYQEVSYLWRRREWVDGKPILVLDGLDAAIDAALAARPGEQG